MQYRLCYKCSVWRTSFCILSGGGGDGFGKGVDRLEQNTCMLCRIFSSASTRRTHIAAC
jgi:hypothetical protein